MGGEEFREEEESTSEKERAKRVGCMLESFFVKENERCAVAVFDQVAAVQQ